MPDSRLALEKGIEVKRHYDFIFCVGRACIATQSLRRAGLQHATFPWDWIGDPGVYERVEHICSDFRNWPRLEDLEWRQAPELFANRKHVVCRRTGLFFLHEFDPAKTIEEQYPQLAAKYERRIGRLFSCIRSSKRVLLLCVDSPHLKGQTPLDEGRRCRRALAEKFPGVEFDFMQMHIEPGRSFAERVDEEVEPGLFHVAYDYRDLKADPKANAVMLDQIAAYLASRFTVRDYRTAEERKSYAERQRRKRDEKLRARMEKFGAKTRAQYEWMRLRKFLRAIDCAVGPRALAARARRRKYEQIAIMGSNCETAFRFVQRWGFVDSSLFAWATTKTVAALAKAIRNMDAIADGPFEFNLRTGMWVNRKMDLHFHGRMKWHPGDQPPSEGQLAADREDLVGRLGHLAEKFRRYAANDVETLFVRRMSKEDAAAPDLARQLDELESALDAVGARRRRLLLVFERADRGSLPPETATRTYRFVEKFNPPERATMPEAGDPVAWNAIFTEFAPAKVLKKAHAFKFEEA